MNHGVEEHHSTVDDVSIGKCCIIPDLLFYSNLNLFMPKFSISVDTTMDETLKEMGITEAYSDMADFSAISEEIKLKVSKVDCRPHVTSF